MGAEIKITKVKCNKGTWEIQWEQAKEGRTTPDVYGLKSDDPPRPELKARLLAMRVHVEEICELPDGAELNIVPRGVSISYSGKNRSVVITASRDLVNSKSPMLINTPARSSHEPEPFGISARMGKDLDGLIFEAKRYIAGDRAQQSLDFGEGEKDKKEEKPPAKKQKGKPGKKRSGEGGGFEAGLVGGDFYPMAAAPMN